MDKFYRSSDNHQIKVSYPFLRTRLQKDCPPTFDKEQSRATLKLQVGIGKEGGERKRNGRVIGKRRVSTRERSINDRALSVNFVAYGSSACPSYLGRSYPPISASLYHNSCRPSRCIVNVARFFLHCFVWSNNNNNNRGYDESKLRSKRFRNERGAD